MNKLTEEQLADLELEKANAKVRMKEVWATVDLLRKLLKTYENNYLRWLARYKEADEILAEHDGRLKKLVDTIKPKRTDEDFGSRLTKEQILEISKRIMAMQPPAPDESEEPVVEEEGIEPILE